MRIAKYISNSGVCSRREAEKLIKDGEVYINKVLCKKPNVNVGLEDQKKVKKKIIKFNKYIRVWKLYKPIKVICSNRDPQKRTTIFDFDTSFSLKVSHSRMCNLSNLLSGKQEMLIIS